MSILQKINTGGWDQNIVDEIKMMITGYGHDHILEVMAQRIEDTLDYEDVEENLRALREDVDTTEDAHRDEVNVLEQANDDMQTAYAALQKDCNAAMIESENMGKVIHALRADAAEAGQKINEAQACFGKHKVT